ncbi:MAG: alpha/beta hydrolase [Oscillatoriales cyanobacterium]|nr:MAG: alpha/beta hydrolase [Oscillatoriales cyanobacterium]
MTDRTIPSPSRSTTEILPGVETQFYTWNGHRCAYEIHQPDQSDDQTNGQPSSSTPIVTLHPIGVGLCRRFWDRLTADWRDRGYRNPLYHPDLLGNGNSALPCLPYTPQDWASQIGYFIETHTDQPVILLVQGASFPIAIELAKAHPDRIAAIVLSGPPSWGVMTQPANPTQQNLSWTLFFNTLLGDWFYRYARTERFLTSFSIKQLFDSSEAVDREWLSTLRTHSRDMNTRHAVFAFLAGFWRRDYSEDLQHLQPPVFTIFGEQASSISKRGKTDPAAKRMADYLAHIPHAQGQIIPGRNVLPYESTSEFVSVMADFLQHHGLLATRL